MFIYLTVIFLYTTDEHRIILIDIYNEVDLMWRKVVTHCPTWFKSGVN